MGLDLNCEIMTENEKIKVLLLGDVTKILNDKAGTKESELCLLLCSSKEFETFTHRDIFDVFTTPQIKMLPAEPLLDDLRDLFKENIEAIEFCNIHGLWGEDRND